MASLRPSVLKHHQKKDDKGSYNVKIAVAHKGGTGYISTDINVVKSQLTPKLKIKDNTVLIKVLKKIKPYEEILEDIFYDISQMTAPELARHLEDKKERRDRENTDASTIDFVKFSENHIKKIRAEGKQGIDNPVLLEQKRKRKDDRERYADKIQTTLWSLCDFLPGRNIAVTDISARMLQGYEDYLKSPRTMTRSDQFGRQVTTTRKGLSESSVIDYMVNIRTLFNAALKYYNDDEQGILIIKHYPFTKYEIGQKKEREKRDFDWEIIRHVRDIEDQVDKPNVNLGRDVFMLQFYLAGMNTVDLYNVTKFNGGKLTYNRTKTRRVRKDNALMIITVPAEALPLMAKYKDHTGNRVFNFYQSYSSPQTFNRSVGRGMKAISEKLIKSNKLDEALHGYDARRGWADIAFNLMDISKDTVGLGLNHVDKDHKTTEIYIKKKFSKMDEANRQMLDALESKTVEHTKDLLPGKKLKR